jgi:hypothetical protein
MSAIMPSLSQFKLWSKQHASLAMSVVAAQAFAQVERERVNAYIDPLFSEYGFKDEDGQPIKDVRHLYLCRDEDLCADFYKACDYEHRKHGFTGKDGHCPALVAEHLQIIAESALIEAGAKLINIESDLYGDNRAKMLDLLLGACLKARA